MTGLSAYNPIQQTLSSVSVIKPGRLNGDYGTGFEGTFKSELDKHSAPVGAAANQANPHIQPRTIDRIGNGIVHRKADAFINAQNSHARKR